MRWAAARCQRFRWWRFPRKATRKSWGKILLGGHGKMEEAGCAVLGGHSISDDEIKFGYAVTGLISPSRILVNSGARAGDALVLTKRLGTGVISTALKREVSGSRPAWHGCGRVHAGSE